MEKLILFSLLLNCFAACFLYKSFRGKLLMPFPIIPLAIAAAQAGYSLYKGHQQRKKAKKLRETNYVPPALEESIASSRLAAAASGPGYNRGKEQLGQSTTNAVNALRRTGGSAGAIQQAVADADARQKEGIKDLEVSDQAFKNQNRQTLNQQLGQKGMYQKESFDAMNAAKSALLGASEQNKYQAVQHGLTAASIVGQNVGKGKFGDPNLDKMGQSKDVGVQGIAGYNTRNMTPEQLKRLLAKMQLEQMMSMQQNNPNQVTPKLYD